MVFCPTGNFLTVQADIGVPEIVESIYLVEIVEFAEFVELCGNCGIAPKNLYKSYFKGIFVPLLSN